MASKRSRSEQRRERRVRKKAAPRKARVSKRPTRRETSYNPLLVLIMFLYMIGLIDKKTVTRIQAALSPKKKARRRRRQRRRMARESRPSR